MAFLFQQHAYAPNCIVGSHPRPTPIANHHQLVTKETVSSYLPE